MKQTIRHKVTKQVFTICYAVIDLPVKFPPRVKCFGNNILD